MYDLPYFKEKDADKIFQFIHEHPFAFMAGCSEDGRPVATQIPVFLENRNGTIFLTGHFMRSTDHHRAFEKNSNVLCVFTGPHTYVSATWYTDPHQASTWNYMSVHVKGILSFLDEHGLIDVLKKTTLHFEKGNADSSTVFDNLPASYRDRLMKAIIAFEVQVESIEHVFKLSQNRDKESFQNIINKLETGDSDAQSISAEMKIRGNELFR